MQKYFWWSIWKIKLLMSKFIGKRRTKVTIAIAITARQKYQQKQLNKPPAENLTFFILPNPSVALQRRSGSQKDGYLSHLLSRFYGSPPCTCYGEGIFIFTVFSKFLLYLKYLLSQMGLGTFLFQRAHLA